MTQLPPLPIQKQWPAPGATDRTVYAFVPWMFNKPTPIPPHPAPTSRPPLTLHPWCLLLSAWHPRPAPTPGMVGLRCSAASYLGGAAATALPTLHRVIHMVAVRKDSGSNPVAASAAKNLTQSRKVAKTQAKNCLSFAALHLCAFALTPGQLGRKPLQPDVRETHRGHRPAQFHRAAGGNRQRCKPPNGFQPSQIIRRIHLHHRRVNQACAREQTHLGRTLDDMIIGNQITIIRDETPCRCGLLEAKRRMPPFV